MMMMMKLHLMHFLRCSGAQTINLQDDLIENTDAKRGQIYI